ncbi:MAG: c-type cytochrome, partial [Candidatus Hydrogenedentales bacterium]
GDAAAALLARPRLLAAGGGAELLAQTVYLVGERGGTDGIVGVMEAATEAQALSPQIRAATLDGLADGLDERDEATWYSGASAKMNATLDSLLNDEDLNVVRAAWRVTDLAARKWNERQETLMADAQVMLRNDKAPLQQRNEALALFAFAPGEDRVDLLFDLLDTRQPPELQRAAIDQLEEIGGADVGARIIAMWDELGRGVLAPASDILLYQRRNHDQLLTALENGDLALGQLNLHLERRRVLLHSGREEVRGRAKKLFTDAGVVTRKEALEKMRLALDLVGDAAKGRVMFQELCIECHRIGGEGTDLGPDLTEIGRKSRETLLHDIVDPNAAVDTQYISYAIETHDGTFVSGIVAQETDNAVTLRAAQGEETTISRGDIKEMFTSGLSIMPEELEVDMDPQEMADLLAFLQAPVLPVE